MIIFQVMVVITAAPAAVWKIMSLKMTLITKWLTPRVTPVMVMQRACLTWSSFPRPMSTSMTAVTTSSLMTPLWTTGTSTPPSRRSRRSMMMLMLWSLVANAPGETWGPVSMSVLDNSGPRCLGCVWPAVERGVHELINWRQFLLYVLCTTILITTWVFGIIFLIIIIAVTSRSATGLEEDTDDIKLLFSQKMFLTLHVVYCLRHLWIPLMTPFLGQSK